MYGNNILTRYNNNVSTINKSVQELKKGNFRFLLKILFIYHHCPLPKKIYSSKNQIPFF